MLSSPLPPAVFGAPPSSLVEVPADALQLSPLVPGATAAADLETGSLGGLAMLAVPGTIERRHDVALALRALAPGVPFTILAPKDAGGSRLAGELAAFGCRVEDRPKRHHRICSGLRPENLEGIEAAIAEGTPRRLPELGLWSQPGIFSWNRIDPGTRLLLASLPRLAGRGADLGCGLGVLAHAILASDKVERLDCVDIDRRAVEAARRNADDPRVSVAWADVRGPLPFASLDFVVTNPPFHDAGHEDRELGQTFLRRAAALLRTGGHLWLVANRHLPYEAVLKTLFKRVTPVTEAEGFKVLTAVK